MATTGNFYIGESEVFPRMLPTKFDSLGKGVSEEKMFSVSAWLISKKCSLLKLFDKINQNLVGSIL
jgi:hypothetical protein